MADFSSGFERGFNMMMMFGRYKAEKEAAQVKAAIDMEKLGLQRADAAIKGAKEMRDSFDWFLQQGHDTASFMFDTVMSDIVPGLNSNSPGWKALKQAFSSEEARRSKDVQALMGVVDQISQLDPQSPLAKIAGSPQMMRRLAGDPAGFIKTFSNASESFAKLEKTRAQNAALNEAMNITGREPQSAEGGGAGLPPNLQASYNQAMSRSKIFARAGMTEQANYWKSVAQNTRTSVSGKAAEAAQVKGATLPYVSKEAEAKALGEHKGIMNTPIEPYTARFLGHGVMSQFGNQLPTQTQLYEKGISIPSPKRMAELNQLEGQTTRFQGKIATLITQVQGRPEILGSVGGFTRFLDNTVSMFKGLANTFTGGDTSFMPLPAKRAEWDTYLKGLNGIATDSSEMRSRLIDLAYNAARVIGGESSRLSDVDVKLFLQALGSAQSPSQFVRAMRSMAARSEMGFQESFKAETGVYKESLGGLDKALGLMSKDELLNLKLPNLDANQYAALKAELRRRGLIR